MRWSHTIQLVTHTSVSFICLKQCITRWHKACIRHSEVTLSEVTLPFHRMVTLHRDQDCELEMLLSEELLNDFQRESSAKTYSEPNTSLNFKPKSY